jgi:hypothetical protein
VDCLPSLLSSPHFTHTLITSPLYSLPSHHTLQDLYTSNSDIISLYSDFYEVEGPLPPGKSAFAMLVYNMTDVTLDMVMTPLYSLIRSNISVPTILMVTPEVDQRFVVHCSFFFLFPLLPSAFVLFLFLFLFPLPGFSSTRLAYFSLILLPLPAFVGWLKAS